MARCDRWKAWLVGVILLSAAWPATGAAQSHELPRLAVVDFEAAPGGWTLPPPRIGETVAQLMLNRLVEANRFHVFDGQWLRNPAATRSRAAEEALIADARRAGVDYLVLGSITRFSMEERQRTAGVGGLFHGLPAGGGYRRQTKRLSVSIMVRVVDVHTGEVVATTTGVGDGKRSRVSAGALLARLPLPLVGGLSSGAASSRDAQLDEATRQAVDTASAGLINAAPRLAGAVARGFD